MFLPGRHAVCGDLTAFQAVVFPALLARWSRPGGVWWIEGSGDLVMETLLLHSALESGKKVARAKIADPHGLPCHDFFQLPGKDPSQTLAWWKGMVRSETGKDPSEAEQKTWAYRAFKNAQPDREENDARFHAWVNQFDTRFKGSLGAVLPETLFPEDHLLWVPAGKLRQNHALSAFLSLWLEQHGLMHPLSVVVSGPAQGLLEEAWLACLRDVPELVCFDPELELHNASALLDVFEAAWCAKNGPAGAVLEEIGGLGRMLGPFSDLPELTSVEWPRYGTWEEEAARASQKHLSTVWSSTPLAAKLARL